MLADENPLVHRHLGEDCGWAGTPDWLDELGAGDLMAVRVNGGRLSVSAELRVGAVPGVALLWGL